MVSTGDLITKSVVINEFYNAVVQYANSWTWHAGYRPPYNTGAYQSAARTAPTSGELPTMITASTLRAIFRDYSYNCSSVRKVRSYNSGCWDWGTAVSNLTSGYRTNYAAFDSAGSGTIITGNEVKAADWNSYMTTLYNAYITARNSTITFATCHCSCHGQCHGSRGRR